MYNVSTKGVTAHVTCRSNPDPNPYTFHQAYATHVRCTDVSFQRAGEVCG